MNPQRRRRTRSQTIPSLAEACDLTSPTFLTQRISAQDRQGEVKRIGAGDYLHASALVNDGFCQRAEVIGRRSGEAIIEPSWGAMRVVWALGRAAEHHVRTQLIKSMPGNSYGDWSCPCGRSSHRGQFKRRTCGSCGHPVAIYGEAHIQSEDYRLSGSPDFVWVHREEFHLVEIKSIKRDGFEALVAPLLNHTHQVKLYAYLYHLAGHRVSQTQRIIYVAKDYIQGGVYREFTVTQNFNAPEPWLTRCLEDALVATQTAEVPPRLMACDNPNSARARRCPMVGTCFSLSA